MSQTSLLVQHDLNNQARRIKIEQATDVKDITDHPQETVVLDLVTTQPLACPDHHVVSQRTKQYQHILRLKTLFAAFGETQPLFVALEAGFDASTTLIVEGHIGQQDGDRISGWRSCRYFGQNLGRRISLLDDGNAHASF